jgi:uncharacterized protein (DUF1778 family)
MGRKKVIADAKTDIRLRVEPSFHRRVQDAADREGNSVAAFIRAAVVKELNRREAEAASERPAVANPPKRPKGKGPK